MTENKRPAPMTATDPADVIDDPWQDLYPTDTEEDGR